MAVTVAITPTDLGAALRIDLPADSDLSGLIDRLIGASVQVCARFVGSNAPNEVADEAVVRLAAYLFDAPEAPPGASYAGAFRNCGSMSLLSPWKKRRAGALALPSNPTIDPDDTGRLGFVTWPFTGRLIWRKKSLIDPSEEFEMFRSSTRILISDLTEDHQFAVPPDSLFVEFNPTGNSHLIVRLPGDDSDLDLRVIEDGFYPLSPITLRRTSTVLVVVALYR